MASRSCSYIGCHFGSSWSSSESPADKTVSRVPRTLRTLSVKMEVRRWRPRGSLEFVTHFLKDSGQVSRRPCNCLSIVCECSQGHRFCNDAPLSSFVFSVLFKECRQGGLLSFLLDFKEDCSQFIWAPLFACPPSRDAQSTHLLVPSCFLTRQWTTLQLGSLAHSKSAFLTRIALDIHPAGCLPFSGQLPQTVSQYWCFRLSDHVERAGTCLQHWLALFC